MTQQLPSPIRAYIDATNRHDVDAMLAPFAETATVRDEGKTHQGLEAIRAWIEDTTAKYRATVAIREIVENAEGALVTLEVAGNFPGSPLPLDFRFGLSDGRISRLEIGA